ncbi:hypothetical protein V9T40_001847 [Parthenolecanium corni]|uniref:C2H2-type domain-containing protein n=1 Tax=Parthenolecanium corni TaxID=536013 RepID=A0AAN9TJA8_9HEMI
MSELNPSLYHLQSSHQSIAFRFFSESVKEIERQINSTASLNFFTTEQIDFIVLICDQFHKLVQLRSKSKLIDNLLTYNFPELFKPITESEVPAANEPVNNKTEEAVAKRPKNKFKFVCDVCDEEVDILNNDPDYSMKLHESSPYHLEVVSVLRKIKESEACTSSMGSSANESTAVPAINSLPKGVGSAPKNVPNKDKFASRIIVSNSKIIQSSKQSPVSSPISEAEESFQRFSWIKAQHQDKYLLWRHSQYYCCLCDADLPTQHNFDAHIRSSAHRANVAAERKTATHNGVGTGYDNQSGTSEVRSASRSTSSDHQNDQIIVNNNGVRFCTLCNVRLPSEANVVSHTNGMPHRTKCEIFRKTFDALNKALSDVTSAGIASSSTSAVSMRSNAAKNETSNVTNDLLVTSNGIQYCSLCNVKIPGKAQQESHFNGSLHKVQLKATKQSPSKAFTDFIISNKDGKGQCILCNVKLPGESQLNGHKYGKMHKMKLKEYEEKQFSS